MTARLGDANSFAMALPPDRLDRFARHIVLPEIGGAGQAALAKARVVLIGVGGIGSPALQYLAGAGIGTLILVDDDTVDASNLQRQTIFRETDVGRRKAELAEVWVNDFDPSLEVIWKTERLTPDNAAEMIADADLVLDGTAVPSRPQPQLLLQRVVDLADGQRGHGIALSNDGSAINAIIVGG